MKSSFLIAAPKSNSGKTLVTLGLIRAFKKRGLKVQPFKCGPDYIDPMHHKKIAEQASYNLDLWMSDKAHVQSVFNTYSEKANVSIAEGVMGLFDGARKDEGSSAAIARLLELPVVLVVDASSVAYSVAPLLYGFKNFDKTIKLAGVIFNKVAGESHFQFLKEAAADADVDVLGYLPRDERLFLESRHLGLHLPGEHKNLDIVETASQLLEKHVNIDLLLRVSEKQNVQANDLPKEMTPPSLHKREEQVLEKNRAATISQYPEVPLGNLGVRKEELGVSKNLKIALAKDEAFNFSYQANTDNLNELGEVTEFSPLHDFILPDADLVWLPGGYPELFAKQLAGNDSIKRAIKKHIKAGKALVAECGGMMYLGNNIITKEGENFEMTGIFDFTTSFENMKLHLGYRELSKNGFSIRGHEFHYSNLINKEKHTTDFETKTARKKKIEMPVFRRENCWASYMHLYLGEKEKMELLFNELGL